MAKAKVNEEKNYTRVVAILEDGSEEVRYKLNGEPVDVSQVPEEFREPATEVVDEREDSQVPALSKSEQKAQDKLDAAEEKNAAKIANTELEKESHVPEEDVEEFVPETREDETPGGPQEPLVVNQNLIIEPAADVNDAGDDVEFQDQIARQQAGQDQDKEGMGFPRKNGKTVDIFDGKTPHTEVRFVGGLMVPLSRKSYEEKSDGEIIEQLKKIGKIS